MKKRIHFPFSFFHFQFGLLLPLTLLMALQTLAAPFSVKDDFRSPRNKEREFRKSTTLIVLHTTEAHAKSALNKLSERGEAHYCVTEKGEVYRIIDRDREAFHAGRSMWNGKEDCDEFSIGIEVVGYHDKTMPLRQLEAVKELLIRLKKMYNLKDSQVVCHSNVAYGAPNTWHKKKHRGRKRCGMLFAMPSVRAKLGLKSRVAYDPDVRAKRLIQVDNYLNCVLYGTVDTMVATYGRGTTTTVAPPKAVVAARPRPAPAPKKVVAAKPVVKPVAKPAAKPVVKPVVVAQRAPIQKPQLRQPVSRPVAVTARAPIVKPPLIVPKVEPAPAEPVEVAVNDDSSAQENNGGWLRYIGLKGLFKKDAKLIVPEQDEPETAEPESPESEKEPERNGDSEPEPQGRGEVLPLPANLHIGKMGDGVRNLEALAKLPGYTRGGPVSANLSPYKIAGAAWKLPSTYYYTPQGKIIRGDQVDEKSVEVGTFVFFRKP